MYKRLNQVKIRFILFIFQISRPFSTPRNISLGAKNWADYPAPCRRRLQLSHTIEGISWRHFHFTNDSCFRLAGMHLLVSPFRSGRRNPNMGRHSILVSLRPEDEKQSPGSSYVGRFRGQRCGSLLQFFFRRKIKKMSAVERKWWPPCLIRRHA